MAAAPRSWLILGPWQTRYGDRRATTTTEPRRTGSCRTGSCRMVDVTADGGRASRVVTWQQLATATPGYQLHPDGSTVVAEQSVTDDGAVWSAPGHGPVPEAMPLALLTPDPGGWTVQLPIRLGDHDGLFFHLATLEPPPGDRPPSGGQPSSEPPPPQHVLAVVLARLPGYSRTAGSHECWYFTHDPDVEYEHKFTLDPAADIYTLARAIHDHIGRGDLTGYRPEYRNDFELWQFDNHLYEVSGPLDSDRGYVSFIPRLNGGHTVKRKRFLHDGPRRFEHKTFWPVTAAGRTDMQRYLDDELHLVTRYLGSFERIRFDVMIESSETGHIYSLVTDRCVVHDTNVVLQQLEIEYIRSRGDTRDCATEIMTELDQLKIWVREVLTARGIDHDAHYTSKYTFLRESTGDSDRGPEAG